MRLFLANCTKVNLPVGNIALQAQVVMVLKCAKARMSKCSVIVISRKSTYNFDVIGFHSEKRSGFEGLALEFARNGIVDLLSTS